MELILNRKQRVVTTGKARTYLRYMITAFDRLRAAIYIQFKQGQAASGVPLGVRADQACRTPPPQLCPRSRTLLEKVTANKLCRFCGIK